MKLGGREDRPNPGSMWGRWEEKNLCKKCGHMKPGAKYYDGTVKKDSCGCKAEKLKTLKDLTKWRIGRGDEKKLWGIGQDELKQEVIKWVKKPCPLGYEDCSHCDGKNMFIEAFFNITEEELTE